MKECKKRIKEMLRDFGYKKISLAEDRNGLEKVYFIYDGEIHIRVNDDLSFHFGNDHYSGCTAHICGNGTDCGTAYFLLEPVFKDFLLGKISEEQIRKDWLS